MKIFFLDYCSLTKSLRLSLLHFVQAVQAVNLFKDKFDFNTAFAKLLKATELSHFEISVTLTAGAAFSSVPPHFFASC